MLEFKSVGYRACGTDIISDITLTVRTGRMTALLGKNGSGKTTLLRAATREIPYSGQILLDGRPSEVIPPRERAKRLGLLPQMLPAVPLSVRELVGLGRTPYLSLLSRPSPADRAVTEHAISTCGLGSLAEAELTTLSGGERQRAFLAMLLAQEVSMMLLDEPTAYLDADARKSTLTLLGHLILSGEKGALVVLHDLNDAIRYADDIALLDRGRLLFCGTVADFLDSHLPEKHFGLSRIGCDGGGLPYFY